MLDCFWGKPRLTEALPGSLSSKCCTWARGWAWPGCSCTSVRLMAVPVQSAAWPGTRTVPGMVLPVPTTGPAPASVGSAGRTSVMATLPCSARARARKVSGSHWAPAGLAQGSHSPHGLGSSPAK